MKARELFERSGPAPVKTPKTPETPDEPRTNPGILPHRHPNPFRRRRPGVAYPKPGTMPKPKAFIRYSENAAPVEAPPKPDVKPGTAPSRPAPSKFPNPFRRRRAPGIQPGPMPKPKACEASQYESKASLMVKRLLA